MFLKLFSAEMEYDLLVCKSQTQQYISVLFI